MFRCRLKLLPEGSDSVYGHGASFQKTETKLIYLICYCVFAQGEGAGDSLRLHVQGTNFQLKVWNALLRIPFGEVVTYGSIAQEIGSPRAQRAVGAAVGANMISLLIPCHRVILSSGVIHNYRWGVARKKAILAMEKALVDA